MALKKHFSDEEKYGLTYEETKLGEKFLRKHKTAGKIPDVESLKLYELFLMGYSFNEIQLQFPQYPVGQIILTAALSGWARDRDKFSNTLRDRIQAKVVKSVIEQVDFITTLLSVNNAEHMNTMRHYIADPVNNPPPTLRIDSIKEYKETVEVLYKIVAGSTPNSKGKTSPLFNALTPSKDNNKNINKNASAAELISEQIDDDE